MTVKLAFIIEVEPAAAQAVAGAIQQALAPLGVATASQPQQPTQPVYQAPPAGMPGATPAAPPAGMPGMPQAGGFAPPAGQPAMPPAMPPAAAQSAPGGGITPQSVYPQLQAYAGVHKPDGVMRVFARYGVNPPRLDAATPEQLAMVSQHFASMQPA